jgi:tetratricopeptide (TPR) repeat protein
MTLTAEEYFQRGLEKAQQGLFEEAIAYWTKAIALDPNDVVTYYNRGNAKSDLGDKRGAILDYDKALKLNPNFALLYAGRGNAKSDLGDKRGAILDYNKAIECNPNDVLSFYNRGVTKSELGDKRGAILDYNKAIKRNPKYAMAYMNRGNDKSDLGDKRGAILDYDKAIKLNPKNAMAHNNRGFTKSALGDKRGAILDYDKAIELDPDIALAHLNRGVTFEEIGATLQAQLDIKRFLLLTDKGDFFGTTQPTFRHFSTYPAPYLLHRSLQIFTDDFEQFNTVHPIVDATRQQCKSWKRWEEWRRLSGSEKAAPLMYYHALALVQHYMGDPIEAYRIYDDVLDDEEIMGVPLNLVGQYYFIESAKLFREPHEAILAFALQALEGSREELITLNAHRELYYAGQILWANDHPVEAHEYFELADAYLPAAYMQVLSLPAVGAEPAEIEAKIANIRAREAALPAEQGFLRGFPARPFRLDKPDEDFLAPILHYAHYREIGEAIAELRRAGEPFEHHELWEAFYWLPEDEKELNWLIRREELAALSRELLTQFKTNVAAQLEDRAADEEMALIEQAFNEVIKKDDWAGTKYADFEDFKTKSASMPGIVQQLARLVSDNRRLGAHNKMLLVEYCYLRGDLDIEEAFLLYFYIGKHAPSNPGSVLEAGLVDGSKKIVELMLSTVSITGQILTAAAAAALTELLLKFSAPDRAPDIDLNDLRGKTGAPLPKSDYDRFVEDFLKFVSRERETLDEEKFAQRFPLEGFDDWRRKRKSAK